MYVGALNLPKFWIDTSTLERNIGIYACGPAYCNDLDRIRQLLMCPTMNLISRHGSPALLRERNFTIPGIMHVDFFFFFTERV